MCKNLGEIYLRSVSEQYWYRSINNAVEYTSRFCA